MKRIALKVFVVISLFFVVDWSQQYFRPLVIGQTAATLFDNTSEAFLAPRMWAGIFNGLWLIPVLVAMIFIVTEVRRAKRNASTTA